MWLTAALLMLMQTPPIPPDSYADSATAELVARTRAARERNERLVTSYTANVSQRIGVGVKALSRDRMLFRQELTARIAWHRDSRSTIEVTGARQAVPVATRTDAVPEGLAGDVRSLVVNPAEDYLSILSNDSDGFVYPLRDGGERDYRYARGDTTRIELPSGRVVRLVELRVTPRRADWQLMSGSLWFDADSYGLVRAVFRPARPYQYRRDSDPDDREGVPSFVDATAEIRYVTMEYGLYEDRWWMLRYVALDGIGSVGRWLDVPVRFERTYTDYEVAGGTPPPEGSTFRPAGSNRRRQQGTELSEPVSEELARQRADSLRAAAEQCFEERRASAAGDTRRDLWIECRRFVRGDTALAVMIPEDTLALLTSPTLGKPILEMGDLITEGELRGLATAIAGLPAAPLGRRLELPRGLSSVLRHARYNRIEALSLGVNGVATAGPFSLDALARIGLADGEPGLEVGLTRMGRSGSVRLGGYRRLAVANPDTRALGVVNSLSALFLQRDDGEYYRALGIDVRGDAPFGDVVSWRLYAERQWSAEVETSASLPHLFNGDRRFRPNLVADSAEQVGAVMTARLGRAFSRSLWLGGDLTVEGATGDFEFGRTAATLRGIVTPEGPWAVALEVAAGTSRGRLPVQSAFFLGGPATLRGYHGGALAGESFWRARAEVGNAFPAARLTAFTDVGWAGPRTMFSTGKPLAGAGVGASFLDGLVRMDLARAMRGPTGWRFDLYFDGRL